MLARWSFEVLQQRFTDMYNAMLTATKVASHTTFLVHEVTYLHEESLAPHKRHDMMTNAAIAKLNAIARNIITKTPHPRVRQVPTFALTRDGDVEPMGDGLHYKVPLPIVCVETFRLTGSIRVTISRSLRISISFMAPVSVSFIDHSEKRQMVSTLQ